MAAQRTSFYLSSDKKETVTPGVTIYLKDKQDVTVLKRSLPIKLLLLKESHVMWLFCEAYSNDIKPHT